MKKINLALFVIAAVAVILTFDSCKEDDTTPIITGGGEDTTTFEADVRPIIISNCTPCHVAGGSETNYSTYNNAANGITSIINLTSKNPGDEKFMPKNGPKLSQTDLDILAKWKSDGLFEK